MSYASFQAAPAGSQQTYECSFHTLTTGISPRHSDTVDVKFMIGGRPIIIALPHSAFAEFKKSTRRPLTDREAIETAGLILKLFIESGRWSGEEEYRPELDETKTSIGRITSS